MIKQLFAKLMAIFIYMIALFGGMILGLSIIAFGNSFSSTESMVFIAIESVICIILLILWVWLLLRVPNSKNILIDLKPSIGGVINFFIAGLFGAFIYKIFGDVFLAVFSYFL